ncbi:heterodisulfide reductase-related iron-sulfur binding cluster [Carboxydothermus ferrireducens]|uniref:Heterodisulfide reductase subunit B n=1 Tax=Carboxydothermus ferrireducens DSM 11255 TaxID=1119529 RepID=A0ABX2R5Z1_9THEO|nr:heterodisulfide reductase-related iron-sulfur binding cluster [Carboxydothermus ferrireducens]NYE56582.1 heterodisulfide reductase subunit B [Carboxydothermus ferrireducens DSM 11255]
MKKITVFWGCQIPGRLAFLEKSTRIGLNALGYEINDIPEFGCCPEKSLIKNEDEKLWLLTAARNLALAEREGYPLVVACNGCSSSLKTAYVKLKGNPGLLAEVNEKLKEYGLRITGSLKVFHLIEFLADEVGAGVIKQRVQKPLRGLKIGVHPGCHQNRPSPAAAFEDPLNPQKYDTLVQALGATTIEYQSKLMCCGNNLTLAGKLDDGWRMARVKIQELTNLRADALTVTCPACFMQFDQKQALYARQGDILNLPVLTYMELLALALGIEAEELNLKEHRIDPSPVLRKAGIINETLPFNEEVLKRCLTCGACEYDCPSARTGVMSPQGIIKRFLNGEIEELINSSEIWECVECHTCLEYCPQRFGMEKVFTWLKHQAMGRDVYPNSLKSGYEMFVKTGRLAKIDDRQRQKLGLPSLSSQEPRQFVEKLL